MRLWLYVVRRAIVAVPVLIGVMTILFVLESSLPLEQRLSAQFGTPPLQDPWVYSPTRPCPPPQSSQACPNPIYGYYIHRLGLDQSVPVQWATYLETLFTFHWGRVANGTTAAASFVDIAGAPVASVLGEGGPYSLELGIIAGAILVGVSLPLGRAAAGRRNQPSDVTIRGISLALRALPAYLLGSILLLVAYLWIGSATGWQNTTPWCPTSEGTISELTGSWPVPSCFPGGLFPTWLPHGLGSSPTGFPTVDALLNSGPWLALDTLLRMLLPAVVIAFASMALLIRFVRASTLEVLNLDYVRTARSQGLSEATILKRHAGRNAYNVTLSVLGLTFATFLGWFPVVEIVFGLNGIGALLATAAMPPYDFGLLLGGTFLLATLAVLASLVVDLLYAYYDPRVRLG